jgi:16S rRNA U1498 N3-methylase RsmE
MCVFCSVLFVLANDSNKARYSWPNDLFRPYTLLVSSTMSIAFGPEGSFMPQEVSYEAFEFIDYCFHKLTIRVFVNHS